MPKKKLLPASVVKAIADHHRGGVTARTCAACPSVCCSRGGFAILENVVLIYEKYQAGELRREDFEFEPGLSFGDFVETYFDVWTHEVETGKGRQRLVAFHMKSIGPDGNLISIPDTGDYWENRTALFNLNPWLNQGCIFLNEKIPDWDESGSLIDRKCILHSPKSATQVTAKPIDCVFHTCKSKMVAKLPDRRMAKRWFRALAENFPESAARFRKKSGPLS